MTEKGKKIDWTDDRWKAMLVYQRREMWYEDTIEKLAKWMNIEPGMTAIDIGCGLGYLGYTYWPYFGKGGTYIGIDNATKNLHEAKEASENWAVDGKAYFVAGNAYKLPFADNTAHLVMCQIVLMHLEYPEKALEEMIRVAKPGGLIFCNEADNLSSSIAVYYDSRPEMSIEEQILLKKVNLIYNRGRIKLGLGDWNNAPKIPHMMKKLGLIDIEIRLNDKVHFLEPPYEGERQQSQLDNLKQFFSEKNYEAWKGQFKKGFIAGGGDLEDWERMEKISKRNIAIMYEQMEKGEYFACGSGHFYVIKGRKAK